MTAEQKQYIKVDVENFKVYIQSLNDQGVIDQGANILIVDFFNNLIELKKEDAKIKNRLAQKKYYDRHKEKVRKENLERYHAKKNNSKK